jgi:hypothetical protein
MFYDCTILRDLFTAHGLLEPNTPNRKIQKVDEDYKSKHCKSPTRIVVHETLDKKEIACFETITFMFVHNTL